MIRNRTIFLDASLLTTCFLLNGCASTPSKTFEKDGIKIIATTEFVEKDYLSLNLYLESPDKIITALRESPNIYFPITKTLRDYTNAVLTANMISSDITLYDENGIVFDYFTYTKTVESYNYKYLGVTKKSESYFYLFNFCCEEKNYQNFSSKFLDWAKLIEVA